MHWRPMATAPKDGTPILVWHKGWSCALTVFYDEKIAMKLQSESIDGYNWIEMTRTKGWPDIAFSHWTHALKAPSE